MLIKNGDRSFRIENTSDEDWIFITRADKEGNEDGEAGDFNASALYEAIDKFFRENF